MKSAYKNLLSFMLISLILIANGHMFQLANGHKGIGVRPTLVILSIQSAVAVLC